VTFVDDVRGLERQIKFTAIGVYKADGGIPLTNCVVELQYDWQWGNNPMLSLRFYHKPASYEFAQKSADAGRPLYDEDTPIGVELNLGPELAKSLIEQMVGRWAELERAWDAVGE
jgi:hypothetical protein